MDLFPESVIKHSIELYTAKISAKSIIIYWIIIMSLIVMIVAMPFIYVDITVQARGLFQSDIEKQAINAPVHGHVAFNIIKNGEKVKKGDTLLVIDTDGLGAYVEALKSIIYENSSCVDDLEILSGISENYSAGLSEIINTSRYRSEFASFERQLELQNYKYQKTMIEHLRNKMLFEHQVISLADYESSVNSINIEKKGIKQLMAYQQVIWQNDLYQRRDDDKRLTAEFELKTEEIRNRVITSPVDGTIIQSADIQSGGFVVPGQLIAEISPDSEIVAVFFIDPADIGFIRMGQEVRFQIDAYNYHHWGMLRGVIMEISDDLIFDGSSAYFRIKCIPGDTSLSLKNGASSEIIKGMTFTARVMITRRTIFNLLFDKADKWLNPYTGNNKKISYAC